MAQQIKRVTCACGKVVAMNTAYRYMYELREDPVEVGFHCRSCANEGFEKQLIHGSDLRYKVNKECECDHEC